MRVNLRDIAGAAASDPRLSLLERCGSMIDYEIFHNLVLVATYIRPPRMMKGADGKPIEFHFTDKTLSEDRFQGKIGLVLKMGPLDAFPVRLVRAANVDPSILRVERLVRCR